MSDEPMKIDPMKRRAWMKMLFGAGGVGLTAAATGVSLSFLRHRQTASAATEDPRFLVLMANAAGDGLNCNAPGTYDAEFVEHPPGTAFEPVDLRLGATAARAARVWEALPEALRARAAFVHHATRTIVHPDQAKVLRLLGDTQNGLSVPEIVASHNSQAGLLDTAHADPVSLTPRARDLFVVNGAPLPRLPPLALKGLLTGGDDPVLESLAEIRARGIDRIHAALREHGNPEQRAYLDRVAQSRIDAQRLGDTAGELLAGVDDDSPLSQVKAAVALIQLRVAPVIGVNLPFGGDNHTDPTLQDEAAAHVEGVAAIAALFAEAESAGVAHQMTFATLNVFGRTVRKMGNGRSHNPAHAVSLIIGPDTIGGVYGGLEDDGTGGRAAAFESTTGAVSDSGDVTFETGLSSLGKTVACAAGLPRSVFDAAIRSGTAVSGIFG